MFKKIYQEMDKEISGERIKETAARIWEIDRWFTYPRFHQSARFSKEEMKKIGLKEVEVLQQEADGKTRYADYIIPQAWDAKDAELRIIEPKDSSKLIASYKKNPASLFMYSGPTPKEGIEAEVILIEDRSSIKKHRSLKGKIIFTPNGRAIYKDIEKLGGIGIISNWVGWGGYPNRGLKWENYSFIPRNKSGLFGFSISEEDGEYLRKLLKKGEKVKVLARVNTKLYNDKAETVTGVIPGKDKKKEILIFAHLYEQGAWDNASGSASVLEIARVLNILIKRKVLPQPKRSIRFMLGWECYSLIGYLTRNKGAKKPIAGLTMDGLGLDPLKYNAPIGIHGTPDSNPSFVDILLEEIAKSYLTGKRNLPVWKLFPHFIGGDSLPSDPCFDIPMPYLYQPCYEIHHFSTDAPEKLMPESLKWSAVVGATYLYFLANAGYKEALILSEEVLKDIKGKIAEETVQIKARVLEILKKDNKMAEEEMRKARERLIYLRNRGIQICSSIQRLIPQESIEEFKEQLAKMRERIIYHAREEHWSIAWMIKNYANEKGLRLSPYVEREAYLQFMEIKLSPSKHDAHLTSLERKTSHMIPKRLIPGILTLETLPEEAKSGCKWGPGYQVLTQPILWTDGERSILEIAKLMKQETMEEVDLEDLYACYLFLEKYGYVRIKRTERAKRKLKKGE